MNELININWCNTILTTNQVAKIVDLLHNLTIAQDREDKMSAAIALDDELSPLGLTWRRDEFCPDRYHIWDKRSISFPEEDKIELIAVDALMKHVFFTAWDCPAQAIRDRLYRMQECIERNRAKEQHNRLFASFLD